MLLGKSVIRVIIGMGVQSTAWCTFSRIYICVLNNCFILPSIFRLHTSSWQYNKYGQTRVRHIRKCVGIRHEWCTPTRKVLFKVRTECLFPGISGSFVLCSLTRCRPFNLVALGTRQNPSKISKAIDYFRPDFWVTWDSKSCCPVGILFGPGYQN